MAANELNLKPQLMQHRLAIQDGCSGDHKAGGTSEQVHLHLLHLIR